MKQLPRRLRVPIPVKFPRPVGLGDVVKRVTTAVGIKPCSGCQRRAQALNRLVQFESRVKK
jgi:hypothetical protein